MKAILMSIRPQYVAKILNGEKTIEIRKTLPKCDLPINVYIYCTKKDSLGRIKDMPRDRYFVDCVETPQDFKKMDRGYDGKGKVVVKFTLNKVDKIHLRFEKYCAGELSQDGLLKYACLTEQELDNYLWSNCCIGYAWHIDNLEIFDKPKEISEFKYCKKFSEIDYMLPIPRKETCERLVALTRAPQSWQFIEV